MTWRDLLAAVPAAAAVIASVICYTAAVSARRAANRASGAATTLLTSLVNRPGRYRPAPPPTRPVWPRTAPTTDGDGDGDGPPWLAPIPEVLWNFYTGRNLTGFRWRGQQVTDPYTYELRAIDRGTGRRYDAAGTVRGGVVFETSAILRPLPGSPAWGMDATQPMPIVPRPRKGEV